MAPEFLEVPGSAAEQGVDAIADFSEQIVAIHAVVVLGMANHRFNGRAAFEQLAQLGVRFLRPAMYTATAFG